MILLRLLGLFLVGLASLFLWGVVLGWSATRPAYREAVWSPLWGVRRGIE